MTWDEVPGDPPAWDFAQASLYADLMMLGQRNPDDRFNIDVPKDVVEDVLLHTGKPALIIPHSGKFGSVGTSMLIAWKPTRECARAVACAVPLMQRAKKVQVVCWGEDSFAPAETPFGVARYLNWHGIVARSAAMPKSPITSASCCCRAPRTKAPTCWSWAATATAACARSCSAAPTRVVLKSMTCPGRAGSCCEIGRSGAS